MRYLLIAATVVACASAPKGASTEVVVISSQKRTSSWPPKKTPEWFDAEIAEILTHIEQHELRAALEQIDRAREERPADETHAPILRELRADVLRRILEIDTIQVSLEPESDPLVFGEPLRFRPFSPSRSVSAPRRPSSVCWTGWCSNRCPTTMAIVWCGSPIRRLGVTLIVLA